jgi:hypothetical protein
MTAARRNMAFLYVYVKTVCYHSDQKGGSRMDEEFLGTVRITRQTLWGRVMAHAMKDIESYAIAS